MGMGWEKDAEATIASANLRGSIPVPPGWSVVEPASRFDPWKIVSATDGGESWFGFQKWDGEVPLFWKAQVEGDLVVASPGVKFSASASQGGLKEFLQAAELEPTLVGRLKERVIRFLLPGWEEVVYVPVPEDWGDKGESLRGYVSEVMAWRRAYAARLLQEE